MDTRTDSSVNGYCSRPWIQTTFLSDGTAVCACIDAARTNPLGNVRDRAFEQVWDGPEYVRLREAIARGDIDSVPICRGCPNRIAHPPPEGVGVRGLARPRVLFLESVAACNLACPGCDREAIEGNRDGRLVMDWSAYEKIVDAHAPDLEYMEYHLGGENFMHKQWPRMLRYARERNPRVFILTSTNGHFFRTERERQDAVESGLDAILFSIDGATPESYARYRVGGDFHAVLANVRGVLEARRRAGRERPYVVWRYILFPWNDTPAEMDLARRMASEIGVDAFAWHLNVASPEMSSSRYHVGSPHLHEIADELWDNMQGRGIPNLRLNEYGRRPESPAPGPGSR